MAFSYLRIIINETEKKIYDYGVKLSDNNAVEFVTKMNNGCRAIVHDDKEYESFIGFHKIGSPKYWCTCLHFRKGVPICEHIIATALSYDRLRGVEDPEVTW